MRFRELQAGIAKMGVMSLDLETEAIKEGLDARNPIDAKLTLIAMASGKGNGVHATAVAPTDEAVEFMVECLKTPRLKVVGHNIFNYDLQVLHHRGIIQLDEVRAKIVDTLPLSWLYNENIPHGLKDMVRKLFKYEMVTFAEAFLLSPNMQLINALMKSIKDIEKTEIGRVGIEFRKKGRAVKKEVLDEWRLRWAKRNTMADRERKKRVKQNSLNGINLIYGAAAIEKKMLQIRESSIQPLLDRIERLEIEVKKDQRKYAEDDARQNIRLYYRLRREMINRGLARWAQMEIDVRRISSEMELNGIKIDLGRLGMLEKIVLETMAEFEARVYNIARQEFNLNSPKQIQKVLYEDLAIVPLTEDRSTDEKTLSRIEHPIGQAILNFRVVQKLNSTYIQKVKGKVLNDPNGRLHGRYNTNGPVTGRWSSSGPNLQNIPSRKKAAEYDNRIQDIGPKIRRVFIATDKHRLICSDLSQIELRLIAHVTGDYNLLEIYKEKAEWDGITYYTGDVHETSRKGVSDMVGFDIGRKLAKNLNFGLCFGMFPEKFAMYAKLFIPGTKDYDVPKAARFRDGFFNLYPGILETIDGLHKIRMGSDQAFPKTHFPTISGRTRYYEKGEWVNGGKILNAIIQGSAADILKAIIWGADKFIVKNPKYRKSKLLLQSHDEVTLEAPASISEEVSILMKYIMEAGWFKIAVPILASAKICNDWGEFNDDGVLEVGVSPPKESGIKPAVAMLTSKQKAWASKIVRVEQFNQVSTDQGFVPLEDIPDELKGRN